MAYYNNNTYQQYTSPASLPTFSQALTPSLVSLVMLGYSFDNPRFRYYLLKLFDIEDDMEFCPDIPEMLAPKKFNPYTAATFLPLLELVLPPRYQGRSRATANSTPAS